MANCSKCGCEMKGSKCGNCEAFSALNSLERKYGKRRVRQIGSVGQYISMAISAGRALRHGRRSR